MVKKLCVAVATAGLCLWVGNLAVVYGQTSYDFGGAGPELMVPELVSLGALAMGELPDGNHPGGCADGPAGQFAKQAKAESLALEPGVAYVGKKIEIPLVFTILYDPYFPQDWYDFIREFYMTEAGRVCTPNVTNGLVVTPESVAMTVEQLNELYGQYHITFKLYDGVDDPIRYVPTWAFAPMFYIGDEMFEPPYRSWLLDTYGVPADEALNVFVGMTSEGGYIGQGAFPWSGEVGDPWLINLDLRTMPGVLPQRLGPKEKTYENVDVTYPCELSKMDDNDVAAHEVGHCLGLFHTWSYSTPNGGGDLVDDTPMEAEPFRGDGIIRNENFVGMPTLDRNTVDDSWYWPNGKDPVDMAKNVMNYGTFHRSESILTPGQVENIFRFIARYRPQFLTKAKPAKPAEDKLLVYLDFADEKLKKGELTNKAQQGQKIPVYVQSQGTPEDGMTFIDLDGDSGLQLSGSTYLYVSEDDLAGPDMDQTQQTFTYAFWFKSDAPEKCLDWGYGPTCTLVQLGTQASGTFGETVDIVPYVDGDPFWGLLVWAFTDASGYTHFRYLSVPMFYITETWNHLAVTYDADAGVTLYFNGYRMPAAGPLGAHIGITFLRIGAKHIFLGDTPYATGLNGSLAQFAFYNEALTPAEIADLMANGPISEDLKGNYRPGK